MELEDKRAQVAHDFEVFVLTLYLDLVDRSGLTGLCNLAGNENFSHQAYHTFISVNPDKTVEPFSRSEMVSNALRRCLYHVMEEYADQMACMADLRRLRMLFLGPV